MSDLQLSETKRFRKHKVGFIAYKNIIFPNKSETYNSYAEQSMIASIRGIDTSHGRMAIVTHNECIIT